MKRTLFIIVALTPFFSFSRINAMNGEPEEGEPIHIEYEQPTHPRSIAPECYYLDGYVYIIGDSSITYISGAVTRLSDNAQWSDSSTGSILQIAVPTDPATYRLTFTLSDGSSYYGDYTLTI